MSSDNIAQLAYLGALLLVLGGAFLLNSKLKLSQTLQMGAIWGLIFVGAAFGGICRKIFIPTRRSLMPAARSRSRAAGMGTITSRLM
jgi:predicted membrane-bound spermidine synthase